MLILCTMTHCRPVIPLLNIHNFLTADELSKNHAVKGLQPKVCTNFLKASSTNFLRAHWPSCFVRATPDALHTALPGEQQLLCWGQSGLWGASEMGQGQPWAVARSVPTLQGVKPIWHFSYMMEIVLAPVE